jgi:hypothetical protein
MSQAKRHFTYVDHLVLSSNINRPHCQSLQFFLTSSHNRKIVLDILVDLKSAKPYGRRLSRASARLPVIARQTLSPLCSAPCLQRHYIREEAPWATLVNPSNGFPPKPFSTDQ